MVAAHTSTVPRATLAYALSGIVALGIASCTGTEWKCVPPSTAVRSDGALVVQYVGQTASFEANDLHAYVTVDGDDRVGLWACRQRDDDMWIIEATASLDPGATLPAHLRVSGGAARMTAVVTHYDAYQVLTDELGGGLGVEMTGVVERFDVTQGELEVDGKVSEPCNLVQCQEDARSLSVQGDLRWEPTP